MTGHKSRFFLLFSAIIRKFFQGFLNLGEIVGVNPYFPTNKAHRGLAIPFFLFPLCWCFCHYFTFYLAQFLHSSKAARTARPTSDLSPS